MKIDQITPYITKYTIYTQLNLRLSVSAFKRLNKQIYLKIKVCRIMHKYCNMHCNTIIHGSHLRTNTHDVIISQCLSYKLMENSSSSHQHTKVYQSPKIDETLLATRD